MLNISRPLLVESSSAKPISLYYLDTVVSRVRFLSQVLFKNVLHTTASAVPVRTWAV